MTNQELYKKFIKYKNENKKITYQLIADRLGTSSGNIHDKFMRLKKGQSVNTKFLIDVEKALGASIFFIK